MKVHIRTFITTIVLLSLFLTGCSNSQNASVNEEKKTIGIVFATFKDTWRTSVRNVLYEMGSNNVNVDILSADNSQNTQSEKVDLLISKKVDVLVINLVESSGAAAIIDKAKNADIPLVFFNTPPSKDDMNKWDKVYYIGAKGEQSGTMQGQLLVNYFKSHPTKDNVIRYVMLKGPEDHADAISRTQYSISTMQDAGLKLESVTVQVASWDRDKAKEIMTNIISSNTDGFDCVLANNDDMALGAIDALKNSGYFTNGKYMPVVGVDATDSAIGAIKNNTLLGSVLNDAQNQGKAVFELATVLADGNLPNKENFNTAITDSKYVWVDYKIITKENAENSN